MRHSMCDVCWTLLAASSCHEPPSKVLTGINEMQVILIEPAASGMKPRVHARGQRLFWMGGAVQQVLGQGVLENFNLGAVCGYVWRRGHGNTQDGCSVRPLPEMIPPASTEVKAYTMRKRTCLPLALHVRAALRLQPARDGLGGFQIESSAAYGEHL